MPRDRWLLSRGRRLVGVAIAAVAALALSACGGSGATYVANHDEGAYFKLPKQWQVVEVPGNQLGEVQALSGFAEVLSTNVWARLAGPKVAEGTPGNELPLIRVVIGDMTRSFRDQISLPFLRQIVSGGEFDPLSADDLKANSSRLLGFEEISSDGMRGYHSRLQTGLDDPATSMVIDQRVLVDDTTTTLVFFDIRCSTNCFSTYVDDINKIVSSWQVRKP